MLRKLFRLNPSFRCSVFDVIRFVTLLDQFQNRILRENFLSQIFSLHFQQGQDRSLELIAKENTAKMYLWKVEVFGGKEKSVGNSGILWN